MNVRPLPRLPALLVIVALCFLAPAAAPAAPSVASLEESLLRQAPALSPEVLRLALGAAGQAFARGLAPRTELLTVIDYSLPSSQRRLWIFDLESGSLLHERLVAHGKGSGENRAAAFSNVSGSLQTSLGLFVTGDTYVGRNGYSLRLHGLEAGVNDRALERAIVMHGAPYVSEEFIRAHGRLGRSWGCPALSPAVAREVIDLIKGGSLIFAYYPQREWLETSSFLAPAEATGTVLAAP